MGRKSFTGGYLVVDQGEDTCLLMLNLIKKQRSQMYLNIPLSDGVYIGVCFQNNDVSLNIIRQLVKQEIFLAEP